MVRSYTMCGLLALVAIPPSFAADVPGSKDPAGVKRYTGSDLIGYRGPKFDEFILPLGPPTDMYAPAYTQMPQVEGTPSQPVRLCGARTGGRLPNCSATIKWNFSGSGW